MSRKLIECVPNFSEGRRTEVIDAIVGCFRNKKGCYLFDDRADKDHNRLVISLVGEPDPIQDALIEAARVAVSLIDMEKHQGGHPRIGAVDVIPFTPIKAITMAECVNLAHTFGNRFHAATGIPVYYYEEAARNPERKKLEVIRKGQYEVLKTEINRPERYPDVGRPALHPSAGATVIGARPFLVAFNVNLNTNDLNVARAIAHAARASGGGFSHVKGIGLPLPGRGMVQVSLNIVDHEKNPLYRVQEFVRMEARRWGVEIVETEVYGMVPAAALLNSTEYYMQVAGFDTRQVIELRLLEMMGDGGDS
jgi:glutamate formiminotransferase / 5-formyltetrahydrofolate cyclo-ligase